MLDRRVVKSDALASVERFDDVQQEKIAQAGEFATQILTPATDLDVLNALRPARGTSTATQIAPIQNPNISGQNEYALRETALAIGFYFGIETPSN